jgi:hypothetical protein
MLNTNTVITISASTTAMPYASGTATKPQNKRMNTFRISYALSFGATMEQQIIFVKKKKKA